MNKPDQIEEFFTYSHYISSIHNRTGSILLSYLATLNKIDEVGENGNWYVPNDDRRINKQRMKELGGALFGYKKHHKELTIIGISKTVEDLIVDLEEFSNFKFKIWKSDMNLKYFEDIKFIRQLNNSIKHSRGMILDDQSHSNRYLIDICNIEVNTEIGSNLRIDIEEYILKSFSFQMDLCHQVLDKKNKYENLNENDIKKLLIPSSVVL